MRIVFGHRSCQNGKREGSKAKVFVRTIQDKSGCYFHLVSNKTGFLFFFMLIFTGFAFGQQQATIMCYNVLNFPTGNIAGREDTLWKVINHVQPDIFLIQELKNDSGLQLILTESFADLDGSYRATTFVPQQSNPSSNFKLQQAMIYNEDLFGLATEGFLQTGVRDLNKFKMYYKDPLLENGADTAFFYVFVVHLKSSQGSANEAARLAMAQTLTTHQQFLTDGASLIVAGDFNVYDSEEPAYQELLDPSNTIVLKDPIETPGNWSSASFEPKEVLTQSTRSSSIFGDGAGGGVDDRFDFILLSEDMFQPWNTIVYEPGSYYAMGNTGTCYNQSVTNCSGGEWTDEMLRSLYYMSDHLPVILKLNFGVGTVGVSNVENTEKETIIVLDGSLTVSWLKAETAVITIHDMLGRVVFTKEVELTSGQNRFALPELEPTQPILVSVRTGTEVITRKVLLQPY